MHMVETAYLRRVPKHVARRMFNEGQTILVVPCNIHPENVWGIGCTVSNCEGHSFEQALNAWSYYHSTLDRSTGRYPAFYVKKEKRRVHLYELNIGDVFFWNGCDYTLGFFYQEERLYPESGADFELVPMVHVTNNKTRRTEELPDDLEVEVLLQ